MARHDADWAVQQYEAVRDVLPVADMPAQSKHAANLEELAEDIDVFLLDAFGVLNVGNTAIPGAPKRVEALKDMGKRVLVVTNGATVPADKAQEKYKGFGFDFDLQDIVSSRDAMTGALQKRPMAERWAAMSASGSQLETLGVPCERLRMEPAVYDAADGFLLLSSSEWDDAQQNLLRESLRRFPRPVIVGNPDIVAPREYGLSREPGYFAYALMQELGLQPHLFGKPFGNIFDLALTRFPKDDPSRIAMVGDTLHTDVLGGAARGFKTVLVTDHGLFAGRDYDAYIRQTSIVPDYIIPEI